VQPKQYSRPFIPPNDKDVYEPSLSKKIIELNDKIDNIQLKNDNKIKELEIKFLKFQRYFSQQNVVLKKEIIKLHNLIMKVENELSSKVNIR
jgi:hypothetical protein